MKIVGFRLPWWGVLIIAVVVGLMVACTSAAVPTLQTPAGPIVCHGSTFVAGSSSHPTFDQSTGYDIDSSCVSATDRRVRHLSQLAVIGVLWLEYGLFAFVVLGLILMLVRAVRGPKQQPFT